MADLFSDGAERTALVNDAAARMGVEPWVIEKDLWVCWTLAELVKINGLPAVTFKGGTSLSKVHRLIERFSEDIDLTFSRDGWGFEGEKDPLAPGLSKNKRQDLIEQIEERSRAVVRDVVVPGLRAACSAQLGATGWSIEIDPEVKDEQAVLFQFPTPAAKYANGKPIVKAEFGARGEPWPTERRVVKPYLEEIHAGVAATAIVEVTTLEPERTFWEKATHLHELHHATLVRPDKDIDERSRHLYDIHRMWRTPELRTRLVASPNVLQAVVKNKQVFFKDPKAKYELVEKFTLNSRPHPELEARLRRDYEAMRSMFFPSSPVPAFDELLVSLREIDEAVMTWSEPHS